MRRWLCFNSSYLSTETGGTEIFAHRLNLALIEKGVKVFAGFYCTAENGARPYDLDGVTCMPLPWPSRDASRLDVWALRPTGLREFGELLDRIQPDVVHFHGPLEVNPPEYILAARQRQCRTVLTFHSPGHSCQQTALLRNGADLCDGRLYVKRCTECCLRWSGVPRVLAQLLATIDMHQIARVVHPRLRHPLERLSGMKLYHARWRQGIDAVDQITYHSQWVRDLLVENGVPASKLLEMPLAPPASEGVAPRDDFWAGDDARGLRLLFMGRLIGIKGLHVLLEALREHLRGERVCLAVLGATGPAEYQRTIEQMAKADPRVRLWQTQDQSAALGAVAVADAVIVPSIWPETGPYTVLEALWLGVPVIGSDRAGIAERLRDCRNCHLFPPGDTKALADCIRRLRIRQETERDASNRDIDAVVSDSF